MMDNVSKLNNAKLVSGEGATQSAFNVPYIDPGMRKYNSGMQAFTDFFGNIYDFVTGNVVQDKLDKSGIIDKLNNAKMAELESKRAEEKPADSVSVSNERLAIYVIAGVFVIFVARKML